MDRQIVHWQFAMAGPGQRSPHVLRQITGSGPGDDETEAPVMTRRTRKRPDPIGSENGLISADQRLPRKSSNRRLNTDGCSQYGLWPASAIVATSACGMCSACMRSSDGGV